MNDLADLSNYDLLDKIADQQARIEELEDALRGLLPFRTAPQMGSYQECQKRIEAARKALSAVKDNNETGK